MYRHFFGTNIEPFGMSPDPRFFFASPVHGEASAALYYLIAERRGFALLVGRPGLGKTSVLVNLAARLSSEARVAFIVHPTISSDSVLQSLLVALGLDPAPDSLERLRQFHSFLMELQTEGKTAVAIIDEAQNLSIESLEVIRMLSNFETPSQKLIQFVLSGQPALEGMLARPECEQIAQRISSVIRLEKLKPEEVSSYIGHRLKVAGVNKSPFSPDAVAAIAAASDGVPRNINKICFNALTFAFAENKRTVDADCVRLAVSEGLLQPASPQSVMPKLTQQAAPVRDERSAAVAEFGIPKFQVLGEIATGRWSAIVTTALTVMTLIGVGLVLGNR